ncbi:MAG: hypothetical protein V1692_01005 [bacterium]
MSMLNGKGQTLMEVVFVMALVIIGLLATLSLIMANILGVGVSENRVVASNLAREGIEIARHIRDSNWLNCQGSCDWAEGLYLSAEDHTAVPAFYYDGLYGGDDSIWSLDFEADNFSDPAARIYIDKHYIDYWSTPLYYNDNGARSETSQLTLYRRLITLDDICSDGAIKEENQGACDSVPDVTKVGIRVISEIRWQERGREQSVVAEDWLYNWY